jgi:uncharacterized membrane protein YhhN
MLAPIALTGLSVILVLWSEGTGRQWGRRLFKPLASVGFVLCALVAGATSTLYGRWILVGLVLCLVGDLFLLSRQRRPFRVGLFSFLMGHLAYAVAFLVRGVDWLWVAAAAVILTTIALPVGRWLLPHVSAGMKPPVLAYIAVISVMVALGAGAFGATHLPTLLTAPVAFYLSDLAVARDRFVQRSFVNRLWGLPLYYAAQVMFAVSVRSI